MGSKFSFLLDTVNFNQRIELANEVSDFNLQSAFRLITKKKSHLFKKGDIIEAIKKLSYPVSIQIRCLHRLIRAISLQLQSMF